MNSGFTVYERRAPRYATREADDVIAMSSDELNVLFKCLLIDAFVL